MDHLDLPQTTWITALALIGLCGCSEGSVPNGTEAIDSTKGGSPSAATTASRASSRASEDTTVGVGGTSDALPSGGRATTSRAVAKGGAVAQETTRTSVAEGARGGRSSKASAMPATSSTGGARVPSASSSSGGSSPSGSASGGSTLGSTQTRGGATSTPDATSPTSGDAANSAGCGLTDYPAACSSSGSPCSVTVESTARTYYVYLPNDYDASKPYPLVFQFHPMGGSAEQAINIPSIRSKFTAIYVTPQGLSSNGTSGWPNTNGQDMAFTKAMLSTVQEHYCVDKKRIFSTGFSYGGMMSFAIGCEMGDVFRAIAPMSGALYSGCKNGNSPIAMWGSHGISDNVVPIGDGRKGRDAILSRNHCGTETSSVTPSPCVSYQGCDSGYPSTWCEFEGSHTPPSFAANAIVDFFKQF